MTKATLLVIDDDETILTVIEEILKKNDFVPLVANTGEDGLKIVNTMPPNAIILDRQMPGMNGDEVLRTIKSSPDTSKIPVIMLTGKNKITEVSECLELGATDYIVKPFDESNFIARIEAALK